MTNLIELDTSNLKPVIHKLLKDRTTDQNIIFATEAYGNEIHFNTQLTEALVSDKTKCDIKPRVLKSLEDQTKRTRKKAEVFTPIWICNKMNNHCDAEWFGYENVFNIENGQDWVPTTSTIEFPKGKTWKDYILSTRLEITCGEAPYLVSRYDVATGEKIPINKRIGILDRKLRIINENVNNRKTWNQWVYRAFESVYGYEYQGDNLLIARINLLETFCEYTQNRWNEEPNESALKRIADIISWNIWQMDGLHGTIPQEGLIIDTDDQNDQYQVSLFDWMNSENPSEIKSLEKKIKTQVTECQIYDWKEKRTIIYNRLKEK